MFRDAALFLIAVYAAVSSFEASYWIPATGQRCASFALVGERGFDVCTRAEP